MKNNKKFYPLSLSSWDKSEISALKRVIRSNKFTMGREVKEYENLFSNFFKTKHAIMVNSGSSANLLMIASLFYTKKKKYKLHRGDEIIVPAVSWSTTYSPLCQYGLKLKFVDVDLNTLNFNLNDLEKAITKKTKAILAVNLLGNPNNFDFINKLCLKKKLILLEDNCESMGAKYKKKYTGTFGLIGTFSSFFSHHISTMEGGMLVTNDNELNDIIRCLRAHGWTRNLDKKNTLIKKNKNIFDEQFRFILPGYNLRPLEFEGATGKVQIKKLNKFLKNRRLNAKTFLDVFKNNKNIIVQKEIGESSWFGFSIILRGEYKDKRIEILNKFEKMGFETRPIVSGNFEKKEVTKFFDYTIHNKLINSDYIDKNGFFIGNHHVDMRNKIKKLKVF